MIQWRYILFTAGFIALSLFGIPIQFDIPEDGANVEQQFRQFLVRYNKSYQVDSVLYRERLAKFKVSLQKIKLLNQGRTHPDSAEFGITIYSDLSEEEFENDLLSKNTILHTEDAKDNKRNHHHHTHHHNRSKRQLPADITQQFNWATKGVVTSVKDQKLCGACWTFSIIETIETMAAMKSGILKELSVQQGIDCAKNGNMGCDGGDTCAFALWMSQNKIKIPLESSYPFVSRTEACKRNLSQENGVEIASNFTCEMLINKEDKLINQIAKHGPVVVAVNALPWQFYLGGVIHQNCPNKLNDINHAVQITGYDLTAPIPHYIVRNSWGTLWGNRGYAKLSIGSNMCGVATRVTSLDVL